jgi:hypothetical protein
MFTLVQKSLKHAQMCDFAFLDEQHILVGFRDAIFDMDNCESAVDSSIRIYTFTDGAEEPAAAACIGSLGLPRTCRSASILDVMFHSNPLPTDHALAPYSAPFWTSPHERIFLIELSIETGDDVDPKALLCIPHHVVHAYMSAMAASAGPLDVPWVAWGTAGSRLFLGQPFHSAWACPAHGSRFIMSWSVTLAPDEEGGAEELAVQVRMYDFGRLAVQKGLAAGEPASPWTYETSPEDLRGNRFHREFGDITHHFEDDLSTRLPFRWTSKAWDQPLGDDVEHLVMLSEDNILIALKGDEARLPVWLGVCPLTSRRSPIASVSHCSTSDQWRLHAERI